MSTRRGMFQMSSPHARIKVPSSAITWRFSRSSGPGGQHVNTSDTRVELICDLTQLSGQETAIERIIARYGTELRVVVSSQRSQSQNRKMALQNLTDKLEKAAKAPRHRMPTKPTWGSTQNRLAQKRKASMRKAERRQQHDE
ncbi:MAG: aminoacyl-tRNA hydrolase [Actinomycetota bacterium]|nr:MAG: aminoacyl-tRNA hydrolase [Actinomycetota bacterium]